MSEHPHLIKIVVSKETAREARNWLEDIFREMDPSEYAERTLVAKLRNAVEAALFVSRQKEENQTPELPL